MSTVIAKIAAYFRRDPTADWPPHCRVPAVLDLVEMTFNHVPIGADATILRIFGRPANSKPFWHETFSYPQSGFEVSAPQGRVASFVVFLAPFLPSSGPWQPASVQLIAPEVGSLDLPTPTSQADITTFLGPPASTERMDDDFVLRYALEKHLLELLSYSDGRVHRIRFSRALSEKTKKCSNI